MADVRALLKAKRQEARVAHPLATYNQNGQLKCSACGTIVKHASAWEGHLGSKNHRTIVLRLKEEERVRQEQKLRDEQEERARGKRKAESEEEFEEEDSQKKARLTGPQSGFPADFFSDGRVLERYEDEDGDDEPMIEVKPKSAVDLEWEQFQKEVVNAADHQETFASATVMAEPELFSQTEGLPAQDQVSEPSKKLTEEEERQKKGLEERELIMDRLLEEERAQEEADMKATMMRNRLEAFKRARASKKS